MQTWPTSKTCWFSSETLTPTSLVLPENGFMQGIMLASNTGSYLKATTSAGAEASAEGPTGFGRSVPGLGHTVGCGTSSSVSSRLTAFTILAACR